jgi:hypothetical protein
MREGMWALETAPNQRLAQNYATRWKEEMKDEAMRKGLLHEAVKACDAIGML